MPSSQPSPRQIQPPKGTRDFYPAEMLRRRSIEKAWRDVSVRHGFDEIDGPTFEHTDLYTVKSGEGIVSEIFGVFSGKDQEQVKAAGTGQAPYALRPEFTPTLARMYAARSGQLPKPAKWFWQQNCFRAERPQRGRLREFLQWNVDFIGGDDTPEAKAAADAEVIACAVMLMQSLGLTPRDVRVHVNDRRLAAELLQSCGVSPDSLTDAFELMDKRVRLGEAQFREAAGTMGLRVEEFDRRAREIAELFHSDRSGQTGDGLRPLREQLTAAGVTEWCVVDPGIVRGLAYYTGTVFELITEGERAVGGGGRYDNLIELFGGPPTPAVGFGMGDVVLSNILHDRGLLPEGKALADKLSEPGPSYRPDVFVISNGTPEADALVRPLVAALRRGSLAAGPGGAGFQPAGGMESPPHLSHPPLHARHSYKSTRKIGKLLEDASSVHSRYAAIIESGAEVTLKNLDSSAQEKVPLAEVGARVAARR
jgi:histidyl-tRNA synthetase